MVRRVFEITVTLNFNFRLMLCSREDLNSALFVLTSSNASNNFTCKCGLRNTDKKHRFNAIT